MPLTIEDARVTTNKISIVFSQTVDSTSATNLNNYKIFDPDSPVFATPSAPAAPIVAALQPDGVTVVFDFSSAATPPFNPGDTLLVIVTGIATAAKPGTPALPGNLATIARDVPDTSGTGKIVRNVEDAIAYPILTEEVGYRPPSMGGVISGVPSSGGGASLGTVAAKAISDVLGWKASATDPKGFVGALTQSFTLTDTEGHVEAKWTPRTYAVQTDLAGGITGAQASLYTRAKDALDKCLPLLDGLYPLDPEADQEDVKALREMARSQMTEITKELGSLGGPSVLRVNTYFQILLGGDPIVFTPPSKVEPEPDKVAGTLGSIRNTYGIFFADNPFSNSVEDEEDITNFRIISDYVTSLEQSWIANGRFFILGTTGEAFFGTQLVLISRQLSVIVETVNEVRFALDSVFIGPSERQTLQLQFADPSLPAMFVEDVLHAVESFASEEGPRLLRDGGRLAVNNNILPVVESLQNLVEAAHTPTNIGSLPDGYKTARVRNALDDLGDQLENLFNLADQVGRDLPGQEPSPAALQQAVTSSQQISLIAVPSALNFGDVDDGTKATLMLTLLNMSTQVSFGNFSLSPNTGFFTFDQAFLPSVLAPLHSGAVAVTFSPPSGTTGPQSATLKVTATYTDAQGVKQQWNIAINLIGVAVSG